LAIAGREGRGKAAELPSFTGALIPNGGLNKDRVPSKAEKEGRREESRAAKPPYERRVGYDLMNILPLTTYSFRFPPEKKGRKEETDNCSLRAARRLRRPSLLICNTALISAVRPAEFVQRRKKKN